MSGKGLGPMSRLMGGMGWIVAAARAAVLVAAIPGWLAAGSQEAGAQAATAPAFEVASIRPSNSTDDLVNFRLANARFGVQDASVVALIRFAYDIRSDDQLPKLPGKMGEDRFDIDAKIADADVEAMKKLRPEERFAEYRTMMRTLLEDRFKLKVSRHEKELPVYALVLAKGGPKAALARVASDAQMKRMPTLSGGSRGEMKAGAVSMAFFCNWISGGKEVDGRVVMDGTGLEGSYDFLLSWTPEQIHADAANGGSLPDAAKPGFLTALEEQLGLKLESRRAPVEVLAIDHLESPSEN